MATPKASKPALVGFWFMHLLPDGHYGWHGQVTAQVNDETYMVQLYDWIVGDPSVKRLAPLASMDGWLFFDSSERMHDYYSDHPAPSGSQL